jgi:alpha-tubulin suppressor-like RCC1 family protein
MSLNRSNAVSVVVAALLLGGCGGGDNVGLEKPVSTVTVTPTTSTLIPGGTVQLQAATKDADGAILPGREITWSSSDNAIATVSATGLVTGVADGSATITATSEGQSGSAVIAVATPTGLNFAAVSAGFGHTCGVTAGGAAYCWGENDYGELGVGTTTGPELCAHVNDRTVACSTVPVPVAGGLSFAAVSTGLQYTCGVTAGGTAYCWGRNGIGQLGDGTTTPRLTPVPVAGGVSFATVIAGSGHTCGVTAAGAAYCWGANDFGMLGDGTTTNRLTPVPVLGGVSFTSVGVGLGHSCGLTAAGTAYCWGSNEEGQLGDGTTTGRLTPVPVAGGLSFASVAASFIHTCGVTTGGAAYCWGWNREGELGVGTATGPETCVFPPPLGGSTDCSTVPVPVAGGVSFTTLSIGVHNLQSCGVTAAGAAYCWGYNANGELGVGTTTGPEMCAQVNASDVPCSTVPVPVAGGISFTAVSAGEAHNCGVTAAGDAYCWGVNGVGQLGDGTTTLRLTPVQVAQ